MGVGNWTVHRWAESVCGSRRLQEIVGLARFQERGPFQSYQTSTSTEKNSPLHLRYVFPGELPFGTIYFTSLLLLS